MDITTFTNARKYYLTNITIKLSVQKNCKKLFRFTISDNIL